MTISRSILIDELTKSKQKKIFRNSFQLHFVEKTIKLLEEIR